MIRQKSGFTLALSAAMLLSLGACSQQSEDAVSEAPQANNFEEVYNSISTETLKQHTKTLSSDEFGGRLPTTPGEKMTLDYLTTELTKVGFEPGNGDSFFQQVDLMQITASPDMTLTLGENKLAYKEDMVAGSKREVSEINLSDSEVIFLGYGVNAPEYDWNDYEDIDVKGKTVIVLVNDPGFASPEGELFQGSTMTYYGRWSYKYEEASRQGAEAVFIVHETAPASYGWSVVANSWSGPQYGLVTPDGGASRVAVEGWISREAAVKLFADAGLDFDEQKDYAAQGAYSEPLNLTASVTVKNDFEKSKSYNVLATLPGSEKPDEHIIYTAHWDHLGTDETKEGDQIYNGAHDNATGTAAILAMAEAFSKLNENPKRSVSMLVVTAEEQGLLGSKYYAENPVIPLDKTVANINMDAMNVLGRTKDVAVIGMGKSELETYLDKAVKRQGRVLTQEDTPQAGYYYRSDHFSFAKLGVPALYAKGGSEPIDEATADYRKKTNLVVRGCYHQVCDQFREGWDFGGIQEDTQMLFEVGYDIANSDDWPKWAPTSEFQR
ncbi:M28 family metallopeptidase [Brumicola blandensis]|jgi:Zn-dependent M28 family amino/carboxypeptidase|uniref:M28 family metallopeptidase n=1 Tax=Brumicola blandensis TaxID=3075611 RepID=A0AAW8QZ98_9ALTE|nr:M28 family metallopeptidase [Alteromonas sp. W409]MDT0581930.1 M28 family metallopeptidase [Alteromonas sp. W409]